MKIIKVSTELEMSVHEFPEGTMREQNKALYDLIGNGCDIVEHQFKFLRDGGDYVEEETGQTKHFNGQLFDSVVFDDSVKEFLALKKKLADYFDEKSVEDIFDYIPPQKTNQIFTPKTMVKKMVDMLEQENPGCFDMPDKTFIIELVFLIRVDILERKCGRHQMMLLHQEELIQKDKVVYICAVIRKQQSRKFGHMHLTMSLSQHLNLIAM